MTQKRQKSAVAVAAGIPWPRCESKRREHQCHLSRGHIGEHAEFGGPARWTDPVVAPSHQRICPRPGCGAAALEDTGVCAAHAVSAPAPAPAPTTYKTGEAMGQWFVVRIVGDRHTVVASNLSTEEASAVTVALLNLSWGQ